MKTCFKKSVDELDHMSAMPCVLHTIKDKKTRIYIHRFPLSKDGKRFVVVHL